VEGWEGGCVLHQQPHTFLGGENGREGHEGLLLASCWCSSPPVCFVRVFKIKKVEIFSSEKSKRNPPPFYPYLFPWLGVRNERVREKERMRGRATRHIWLMNFGRVSGARIVAAFAWMASVGRLVVKDFSFSFLRFLGGWLGCSACHPAAPDSQLPAILPTGMLHTHTAAVHVAVTRDYINALGAHHVNRSSRKIFDWLFSHTRTN
jgi:hypothetical protein